ncbi:MAG: hypothetical protein ACLU9S_09435 [Oscillospiraceae bacterium]
MELLDLVDENGVPTGRSKSGSWCTGTEIWHRTSHVCLSDSGTAGGSPLPREQKRFIRYAMTSPAPGTFQPVWTGCPRPSGSWRRSWACTCRQSGNSTWPSARALTEGPLYGGPLRDRQVSRVYYGVWEGEPGLAPPGKRGLWWSGWILRSAVEAVTANAIPTAFSEELDLLAQALRIPENKQGLLQK